jgi:protein TonB
MIKFSTLAFLLLVINFLGAQNIIPAEPVSGTLLTKDFICNEIVYPKEEFKDKVEGTVKFSFIVNAIGDVTDIKIEEMVSPGIDAEALRVFKMILWKPAVRLGQPIASRMAYEIDFNVKKYKKHCRRRGYDDLTLPYSPVDTSLDIYSLKELDQAPVPFFKSKSMNLAKFMQENLEYPEQAYRQNISGKVVLNFLVEPHGRVSNITIHEALGGGCNEEAIRLLKMLSWVPGVKDETAVRSNMHMDITFSLPSDTQHQLFDYNQNTSF